MITPRICIICEVYQELSQIAAIAPATQSVGFDRIFGEGNCSGLRVDGTSYPKLPQKTSCSTSAIEPLKPLYMAQGARFHRGFPCIPNILIKRNDLLWPCTKLNMTLISKNYAIEI